MTFYAQTGQRIQIWRDNVQLRNGYAALELEVVSGPGVASLDTHLEDRWILSFDTAGTYYWRLNSPDSGFTSALSSVIVTDPLVGTEPPKKVAMFGDSISAASLGYVKQVKDTIGTPVTLVGTIEIDAGYPQEGKSGWHWELFATSASSVLVSGGVIDIANYESVVLGDTPDVYMFLLNTNLFFTTPLASIESVIDSELGYAEAIVNGIQADNPGADIVICTGFMGNQRNTGPTWSTTRWDNRQKQHRVVERTRQAFDGRQAERVYCLQTHAQIDPFNGYPSNNAVHPVISEGGHVQIAQTYIDFLTYLIAA